MFPRPAPQPRTPYPTLAIYQESKPRALASWRRNSSVVPASRSSREVWTRVIFRGDVQLLWMPARWGPLLSLLRCEFVLTLVQSSLFQAGFLSAVFSSCHYGCVYASVHRTPEGQGSPLSPVPPSQCHSPASIRNPC